MQDQDGQNNNKSRRFKWANNVARIEKGRNAFKIVTGKPTRKIPLGWEDNITMNLKEIGFNTGNWVDSVQDRVYWRYSPLGEEFSVSI